VKRVSTFAVVVFALSSLISIPSYAAKVSGKQVLVYFQNYLTKAESEYNSNTAKVKQQLEIAIETSEKKIRQAKQDFLRSNQIKVIKLGDNRNYWGSFNCPMTRPDCIYVDKGPKFEVGEVTTIKEVVSSKTEYLNEIDLIVSLGLIELLTPTEFQLASKTIREQTAAMAASQSKFKADMLSIESKFEEANKVQPAILAIKRALKTPNSFEAAFVTALKFEYNREKLDELARLPFRYIDSLKTLDSAIKVTRISEDADTVASRYSYTGARKINTICGKTFITEIEFKEMYGKIASLYREATGSKLPQ
jgi:hypothetical protein